MALPTVLSLIDWDNPSRFVMLLRMTILVVQYRCHVRLSSSKQVAQLGKLGLMGVAISEENGGTGLDYLVRQDGIQDREQEVPEIRLSGHCHSIAIHYYHITASKGKEPHPTGRLYL